MSKVKVKVTLSDENGVMLDSFIIVGNEGTPDDIALQRGIREILEDQFDEVEEA